ncbi:alanine racemase [Arthrobacter sp. MMS18-M83]|uniref:alanine racemase n=1 Tax=Arthrobacter sp. MMS18-M83 TaxID=2996261 RepID=UPI002DD4507B|nr:alanine racemase [Arthrobacter sp. MMS18-M83]
MNTVPETIDTPAILIDREVLARNIARMASTVKGKGLTLRPHVKTHKIPQIAALQLEAGAVREASRLLGADAGRLSVLVEIDSGHHRSGVRPEDAAGVADAARDAGFHVAGVFTFPGNSYAPSMPEAAVDQAGAALERAAAALRQAGHDVAVLSGGSTPTALLTGASVATELRPGVYVFGDAQQLELGRCVRWKTSR